MTNTTDEVLVRVQATPNPGAWKYIINKPVLNEGKASFATKEEAFGNRLAEDLLNIEGVKHIHFFGNVITVTFHFDMEPEELHPSVISVIQTRMPVHDANFGIQASASKRTSSRIARNRKHFGSHNSSRFTGRRGRHRSIKVRGQ